MRGILMETIQIHTDSKNYDVYVGEGVRKEIGPFLANHFDGLSRILIITDETVAKLHLEKLLFELKSLNPVIFTAPSGEKAKTFEVFYLALSTALENKLDRKSVILSFGGGCWRFVRICCGILYEGHSIYTGANYYISS